MRASFLIETLWPHRWPLTLSLALMLLESGAVLVVPWLGGHIAGGILAETDLPVATLALALIALLAAQAAFRVIHRYLLEQASERLMADLRIDLYDHIQRQPLPWLDSQRRGDLLSLIIHEVDWLSNFVTGTLLSILPRLLVLVGAAVVMIRIDAILAIPVILGVPIFYLLLKLMGRNIRPLAIRIRSAYADFISTAEENLTVVQAIKAYAREDLETKRFSTRVDLYRDLNTRMARHQSLLGPILQFLAAASVVLVIWLADQRVADGVLSAPELISLLLYAALLTRPVSGLAEVWGQFQHASGALRQMDRVLAIETEPTGEHPLNTPVQGAIRFEEVHFHHPGRDPLLTGVSFDIASGETVAITGENGAGKTTLVELLLRFRQPDGGRILLDGQAISGLDLAGYRRAIALVPQREALIDGTITDNIRFGRPDASAEEIETAARNSEAWDFISALPDGLETLIGEGGIRLSGGQRQRVALARALVKDPAILVLDEPTAMFDPAGEARFVEIARRAFSGKTVILITHRPASLVLADRVLTLQSGQCHEAEAAP